MVNFYLKKTVYKGLNRGAKIYLINLLTYVLHLLFLDRRQWLYIIKFVSYNFVLNHHKNLEFHLYWISRNKSTLDILLFCPLSQINETIPPLNVYLLRWDSESDGPQINSLIWFNARKYEENTLQNIACSIFLTILMKFIQSKEMQFIFIFQVQAIIKVYNLVPWLPQAAIFQF